MKGWIDPHSLIFQRIKRKTRAFAALFFCSLKSFVPFKDAKFVALLL